VYVDLLLILVAVALVALGLHLWIRSRPSLSYRTIAASLLTKAYPASVRELLLRDRFSVWHKTAQSERKQGVWGYVDKHSIGPGGIFQLMLSAAPGSSVVSGRVEIYRVGYYGGEDRRRVWVSDPIEVEPYIAIRDGVVSNLLENTVGALGPNWPPSIRITKTLDWQSGYYSIDFVEESSSRDSDIAFIVVTDLSRSGDVLVKLSTATYQAYNTWGGHSLYDWGAQSLFEDDRARPRGHMVSFDRPTPSEFYEWEYDFVLWLEKLAREEGFSVSYATNFDVASCGSFTSNYKLLISVGHDEYWTKEEFERTYDRIFRQGGNTLFLGANTAYWQVRYVNVNDPDNEGGRQLVCYKSLVDPIANRVSLDPELQVTARFRDGARFPETMLLGSAYQSNFKDRYQMEPGYAYHIEKADHPLFEGTGYKRGDFVGEIIGHEWDNREPEAEYPAPGQSIVEDASRLWNEKRSRIDSIPLDQIQVLFAGYPVDLFGREGRAEGVYFESPAGAKVFNAGTIRWSWGLGKEGYTQEKFQRFNRNLVLQFLRN